MINFRKIKKNCENKKIIFLTGGAMCGKSTMANFICNTNKISSNKCEIIEFNYHVRDIKARYESIELLISNIKNNFKRNNKTIVCFNSNDDRNFNDLILSMPKYIKKEIISFKIDIQNVF